MNLREVNNLGRNYMQTQIEKFKEEITDIENESSELEFMICSMECDLQSLESRKEGIEEDIEEIENSKEYQEWKEERTVVLPGQISLMDAIQTI